MADQGRWFKLWVSALDDVPLDTLPMADFGRWAKLGAFTKEQGTDGRLVIAPPARTLCTMLQVSDYATLIETVRSFPHLGVTITDRHAIVIFQNWHKYQIDSSAERMRTKREKDRIGVTPKKRREEKRREENKKDTPMKTIYGEFVLLTMDQ